MCYFIVKWCWSWWERTEMHVKMPSRIQEITKKEHFLKCKTIEWVCLSQCAWDTCKTSCWVKMKAANISRITCPLPGKITAPDVSSSWLTSDASLGRAELLAQEELDTEASPTAVPLAALGLCDSSPLFLCRLLSLLMVSSRCPVDIIINSGHKSDRLSKWYLLSNNCTKIQYNQ